MSCELEAPESLTDDELRSMIAAAPLPTYLQAGTGCFFCGALCSGLLQICDECHAKSPARKSKLVTCGYCEKEKDPIDMCGDVCQNCNERAYERQQEKMWGSDEPQTDRERAEVERVRR